jgi:UDP-N-acetylmuramoylalanine--D-glutamate ligase
MEAAVKATGNISTAEIWVVAGLGITGLSVVRHLHRLGLDFTVWDTRAQPPALETFRREFPKVDHVFGEADPEILSKASFVVASPGLSLELPALRRARGAGARILGDVELFAREVRAPVAAITGSNGKSTVTMLVGEMARGAGRRVAVGGNIGTPALDLLQTAETDLYVLELSSFQLDTTESFRAEAAAVLNVSADHLDRYTSLADYASSKGRIYAGAGYKIVNLDDPLAASLAGADGPRIGFTLSAPAPGDYGIRCLDGDDWIARGDEALMPVTDLRLSGRHNVANLLAALALGEAVGLERGAMLEAAKHFPGLAHRCQFVGDVGGVHWINDSKGTNPGATLAAITGLRGPLVLIAGGDGKGADFDALRGVLAEKVRACVLIGRDAPRLRASWEGSTALFDATDMHDAVRMAFELAQPGDTVLLSPACASLDMYSSYAARGEAFMRAVERLEI